MKQFANTSLKLVKPKFHGLFLVISGGQTGSDQGGLQAAHFMDVETGGFAPKGWRTCRGPNPQLAQYGLVEHASEQYADRTKANVHASRGTVIIASDDKSPGTRTTIRACRAEDKPFKLFKLNEATTDENLADMALELSKWIENENIYVLNVAGNRDGFGTIFHHRMSYMIVMRALLDLESRKLLVQRGV